MKKLTRVPPLRVTQSTGEVVEDILLLLEIEPVRISRSFDIDLGGQPGKRNIEISNPYAEEKHFHIHTSKTGGVRVKLSDICIDAKKSVFIEIQMSGKLGRHLVFITGIIIDVIFCRISNHEIRF